jgi:hypothetical protein
MNLVLYQSEDISLLKKEIEQGVKYITQMTALRQECALLSNNTKQVASSKSSLKRQAFRNPSPIFK